MTFVFSGVYYGIHGVFFQTVVNIMARPLEAPAIRGPGH